MNFYLNKYGFLPPQIPHEPSGDLGIIVVIPCFNEPDLISSLQSLLDCDAPKCHVEVITVLNSGEHASEEVLTQNAKTLAEFQVWNNPEKQITFHLIHQPSLPKKHAGVGLARKIGMDEAVSRFHSIGRDGVIVCFDADAKCDSNYLKEIEHHFENNPSTPGCSVHYEHPIEGNEFSEKIYQGIINYELHLRYYNQCLRYCELPYAYHTVGSSMAVRSSAYQKQGGMNKRKAGEDFYFIHKIIALGGFTELNSTRVIPSPRTSDRVPFGTGKAIADWVNAETEDYATYNFETFEEIRKFRLAVPDLYEGKGISAIGISVAFIDWLEENEFATKLEEAKSQSVGYASFEKRFFVWFDAFRVLKLVHFLRDTTHSNESVRLSSAKFLFSKQVLEPENQKTIDLLKLFRGLDTAHYDLGTV